MDINELWDKYSARLKSEAAEIRMSECHTGYDYKTDPLYYAADKIRQKRREAHGRQQTISKTMERQEQGQNSNLQ